MKILNRGSLAALSVGVITLAASSSAVPANAHNVTCTNDAQTPFYNSRPDPGRAPVQGATIIECVPTAPDAQRTEVQLQWNPTGRWDSRGDSYISFSNARFHRVYDSTTCRAGQTRGWRVRATHSGRHGNTVVKTDIGSARSITCPR